MIEGLRVVDGDSLPGDVRGVLCPGEEVRDHEGRKRILPRVFYEVESWETARNVLLSQNMSLWEFMNVDVREADIARRFPRYIPCAVAVMAAHLSVFRQRVDTYVHIAANGGYRSPAHGRSGGLETHQWGTAADIYRVGDDYLEDATTIEKYAAIAREVLPAAYCAPVGHGEGESDDHLHIDIGYVIAEPH